MCKSDGLIHEVETKQSDRLKTRPICLHFTRTKNELRQARHLAGNRGKRWEKTTRLPFTTHVASRYKTDHRLV